MKTFLCILFAAATILADDWPRFRGPNGSGIGVAANVPAQWTEKDYNWTVKLPGVGHSCPVIVGNRLFVTCADETANKGVVLCLDAATGKTLWQHAVPVKPHRQNKDNSLATSTPAADERGVVVVWADPDQVLMLALDNTGKEMWRRDLGPLVSQHGFATSPIIESGLVILNNDQDDPSAIPSNKGKAVAAPGKSFVIALDRATGKTRWQLDRVTKMGTYGTPCLRGNELILCSTAEGVVGVDLATGKVNWQLPDVFDKRCVASPALCGDIILQGCGVGGVGTSFSAVKAGSKPEQIYQMEKPVPYVPCPLVKDGKLFAWADAGTVSCLDAATGKIIWRDRVQGAFYSSPVWISGRLYNVAKNGDVFVLGAGDKFELLARVPLGDKCHSSPAVANGALYLRTFTQLFSVGGK
jgi:outer membrane protein assembly factor BamB